MSNNRTGIEEYIPFGKEHATTRKFLVLLVGTTDRKMREMIEASRRRGNIIINDQSGSGYYRIQQHENPEEYTKDELDAIAAQYRQNERRAKSVLVQQKHLRRILKAAGREV